MERRVVIDTEECVGCESCVELCDEVTDIALNPLATGLFCAICIVMEP